MSFDHEVNLVKTELGPYRFGAEQAAQTEQPENKKGGTQPRQQDPPALLDALEIACRDLPISPAETRAALAPEDRAAWESKNLPMDTLHDFAKVLSWHRRPLPTTGCGRCALPVAPYGIGGLAKP